MPRSRIVRADDGLLPENCERLNRDFYEARPWLYFDRRLVNLARVTGNMGRRGSGTETYRIGPVEITETRREIPDDEPVGLDDQSFVAAEAEVLHHHTSETLLRLVHAHAPEDGVHPACPWLAMSRVTAPGPLKDWVRQEITAPPAGDVQELIRCVFGDVIGSEDIPAATSQLRVCGRHFLDAAPYNAAKHGFALQGARSRLTVNLAGIDALEDEGLTITWLGVRGNPPRWAHTTRWFSIEATMVISFLASRLIEALWIAGRHRYLGESPERRFKPADPAEVFAACGVLTTSLAELDEQLRYGDEEHKLLIRKGVHASDSGAADSTTA
jgi:hypothetical protein